MKHRHILPLLLASILLALASCATPGGVGAVGSVVAGDSSPNARPSLLVRYDGDTLVAWARAGAEASLFFKNAEPRSYLMPPVRWADGRAIVHIRSEDYKWEGSIDDPLPAWAAPMFSFEERQAWGLQFFQLP